MTNAPNSQGPVEARNPKSKTHFGLGRNLRILKFGFFGVLGCLAVSSFPAFGQSVQAPISDPSPEAQLAAFKLHEDFEISLFADESLGIANPIAMHWDHQGRLWVLTTLAYAQLGPGEKPNDKLFILEDTDQDGKADKSSVFADGLDMPTGFALGLGGVYIGEGANLLFLKDTDGDDKADLREVVLAGFGFGDTHQNISNFTWGPDGCLYFCQGLHTYSRVETPWDIVRGDQAGFWRFHPRTLKLEPFCFPSLASQNPCGMTFDNTGALFVKSNNRELIYATPGLIPTTNPLNLVPVASIGVTPGKSMGGEFVESPHLPDWIQNHILIAGYYSHRVTAFPLVEDGAGYARVEPVELLVSSHESFRPVEIRIGPDGAIYVADWFNPIIGHYQASLRHPDRDKAHGRIWRLTARDRDLATEFIPFSVRLNPSADQADPSGGFRKILNPKRMTLDRIVELANIPEPESLKTVLTALDEEGDRFIKYALTQTVHALADQWLPAVQSGELEFDQPHHLAFALETLGGSDSAAIARKMLSEPDLTSAVRTRFAMVLAKVGTPEDLRKLLDRPQTDSGILEALIESWRTHQRRPAPPFAPRLKELIASEDTSVRASAIALTGLWQAKSLADEVQTIAIDSTEPNGIRIPALHALARLKGKEATASIAEIAEQKEDITPLLRRGAVEALTLVDLPKAAQVAAEILTSDAWSEVSAGFLVPFLNRKGGTDALAAALKNSKLEPATAQKLATALSTMGRTEPKLSAVITSALGLQTGAPEYSADRVAELVAAVRTSGDVKEGAEIYQRAQLNCVACHQIGGVGGILGPNLDTVGAGLPLDLIVESVLWPNRQLKEGYFAVTVTTKDGNVFTGYEEKGAEGILWLRDTATGKRQPITPANIAQRNNIGTLMPAGLTNSLKPEELRDLIAYLATLKGQKEANADAPKN